MVAKTSEPARSLPEKKDDPLPPIAAKPRSGGLRRTITLAIVVAAGAGGGAYAYSRRGLESTDNAQIDADVVAVPARASGIVAKVFVSDNQVVKAGELLAVLDDAHARASLREADARLAVAEANAEAAEADERVASTNANGNKALSKAALTTASMGALGASDQIGEAETALRSAETSAKQASIDLERAKSLFESGAITKVQIDQAETAETLARNALDGARARLGTLKVSQAQAESRVAEASVKADQASDVVALVAQAQARSKAARAQVETAKAALDLAKIDLENTEIHAPTDGTISKKSIAEGQAVTLGQPIAQLVTPTVWVSANFKETQIEKMHVGQSAEIEIDAFPGVKLSGEVASFSATTGSRFTLLPPDNASGNFTKVVQRVPLKVRITKVPNGIELRPGMSVELTVKTR